MNQIAADFSRHTPAITARPPLSRRQKAAVIVRLLLSEGAQLHLDDLPDSVQLDLTREMGRMRMVDRETLTEVAGEFLGEMRELGMAFPGGLAGALDLLDSALSPVSIQRLRQQTGIMVKGDPWKALEALPAERLAARLRAESTEIAAVILTNLPIRHAALVLAALPGDIARRIALAASRTRDVDPQTVRTIGLSFAAQFAADPLPAYAGEPAARIGAILNSSPAAARERLLADIQAEDEALANDVRKAIFTFANIPDRIATKDVPTISRAVEQDLLVLALMAGQKSHPEASEYLFESMSQRFATQLRDEIEERPDLSEAEGEDAMIAFVEAVRDLDAAGEIRLIDPAQ